MCKLIELISAMSLASLDNEESNTRFSKLSKEAQDVIVNAFLGETATNLPESVVKELQWWASEEEEEKWEYTYHEGRPSWHTQRGGHDFATRSIHRFTEREHENYLTNAKARGVDPVHWTRREIPK